MFCYKDKTKSKTELGGGPKPQRLTVCWVIDIETQASSKEEWSKGKDAVVGETR